MVRAPSFDKNGMKKGAWSEEEDNKLRSYVKKYGHWNWRQLPKFAGLNRCGKSCRLRWMNYLKPGVRRGKYTPQEDELILRLHREFGNKWSVIASKLPGRTDNDIKNRWHAHLSRKAMVVMKQGSMSPTSYQETYQTSQDSDHQVEGSSSISTVTFESTQLIEQMMEINNYDNNIAASVDHSYSEVSSFSSYEYLLTQLDWTAKESLGSVESIIEHFDENSFWDQPFSMDSSFDNHLFDHDKNQQFLAATLEEEIMRPFSTPSLDEINIDYWLHELME